MSKRTLIVMADYAIGICNRTQLPIWEGMSLVETTELSLPVAMREMLITWNEAYEKIPSDQLPSDEFISEGRTAAAAVQQYLGEGVEVLYYNEFTHLREKMKIV